MVQWDVLYGSFTGQRQRVWGCKDRREVQVQTDGRVCQKGIVRIGGRSKWGDVCHFTGAGSLYWAVDRKKWGHRQQERKLRTNQRVENIIDTKHENEIGLNKGKTKGGKERRGKGWEWEWEDKGLSWNEWERNSGGFFPLLGSSQVSESPQRDGQAKRHQFPNKEQLQPLPH